MENRPYVHFNVCCSLLCTMYAVTAQNAYHMCVAVIPTVFTHMYPQINQYGGSTSITVADFK